MIHLLPNVLAQETLCRLSVPANIGPHPDEWEIDNICPDCRLAAVLAGLKIRKLFQYDPDHLDLPPGSMDI